MRRQGVFLDPRLRSSLTAMNSDGVVDYGTTMTDSDPDRFAAELLERGAPSFAGYAATLLLQSDPGIAERFGPDAFGGWKSHLTQRILELTAALRAADSAVFVGRVLWTRKAFQARSRAVEDLQAALESLQQGDVLFALLAREPVFLFPELAKREHEWAGNFDASGTTYRLLVRHGGGKAHG